jgi:signal transduction histidine kinase
LPRERHVALIKNFPDNVVTVEANRNELDRLSINLVSNAIKYNRGGGQVRIAVTQSREYLRVEGEDTGLRISAKDYQHLFEDFFRAKTPKAQRITGTGLGLSIVRKTVDAYHGRIEVKSELGKGSTFSVYLPAGPGPLVRNEPLFRFGADRSSRSLSNVLSILSPWVSDPEG